MGIGVYICTIKNDKHLNKMNNPTIIIRNAKFTFSKSFSTANAPEGCVSQSEYVGQRGRSVFVQFFSNGTARAIGNNGVQSVTL